MEVVEAHKGYFQEEVPFVSVDSLLVKVPKNRQITILWDAETTAPETNTKSQKQLEAFERFVARNRAITDEPFTEEFDAIIASGVNIGREIDL
jgi:hypothetical protein